MSDMNNAKHTLYLALQSRGIIELSFEPNGDSEASLSIVGETEAGTMPGWISLHDDKLYSISRTSSANPSSGEILAFSTGPNAGFARLDRTSAHGEGGVHVEVSPDGRMLVAATITGNSLSFYEIGSNGQLKPIQHVYYNDLEGPGAIAAPHQVAFDPSGQYIFVPLRSLDRIDIYLVSATVSKVHAIQLPKSVGPRHVTMCQKGPGLMYLYTACEKDNSLRVFSVRHEVLDKPTVICVQVLSVLGVDHVLTKPEYKDMAGEIAMSKDGSFLYVSNRSIDPSKHDTIAIFSISHEGLASFITRQSIRGLHPRMFALSPDDDNKYIAVCNQFDQTVTVFERDPITGLLKGLRGKLHVSPLALAGQPDPALDMQVIRKNQKEGPMCIQWKR